MRPLLIEIGSEEIPARFVSIGIELLRKGLKQLLHELHLDFEKIYAYYTPRRLTLSVSSVAEVQKDRITESVGPPRNVAYDKSGNPTKAAAGFARSLGIDVNDLKIKQTDRGEYVYAVVETKGKSAHAVLSEALPKLIQSLHLPKSMRWGNSSLRFFRPIHWILALFGNEVISFQLDTISSGNISYGHRFLSPVAIKIEDPASYLTLLKQHLVIADPSERKGVIMEGIKVIETSSGLIIHKDVELLETVSNLVEYPSVVHGSFDKHFLDLPRQLLITVMKTHQKYFSVEDGEGNMHPSFVVVSNTDSNNNDIVRKGAERVLRARLEDARFYFNEDQEISLSEHVEKLKKVSFQEKLGSLYEKTERISTLSSSIADQLNFQKKEKLQRACLLCKADLVTGVVGEFPELQGYMGMIYALNSGEDGEVASAIYEHYLPKFAGDSIPENELGAIISLADKMDNITSFFYLDLIPTGSEDPFALRRQAAGILNILQDKDYPVSLESLMEISLRNLEISDESRKILSEEILHFFYPRLEGIFQSQRYRSDIINAALASGNTIISDLKHRIEIMSSLTTDDRFTELLTAATRVYNILVNAKPAAVDEMLLIEPAEKELFSAVNAARDKLESSNFRVLFELQAPINTFFDNVLVMDKDQRVKDNRLALLYSVKNVFDSLGDFSKITG